MTWNEAVVLLQKGVSVYRMVPYDGTRDQKRVLDGSEGDPVLVADLIATDWALLYPEDTNGKKER